MSLAHRPARRTGRTLTALAAAGALTLGLTACGEESGSEGSSSSSSSSSSSASSGATSAVTDGSLDDVTVTDVKDKAPTIEATTPFGVGEFATKVLKEGSGEGSTDKQVAIIDYELVNGTDGKVLDESYTREDASFDIGDDTLISGLQKALTGVKKGSRVIAALPPADAFGEQGNTDLGVAGTDTLIFLVDVVDLVTKLDQATGKEVAPEDDLPVVTWNADAAASFEMPKEDPPTELVSQPLIEGEGATVADGDSVVVTYTGALWRNGEVFDSSFNRGSTFGFQIGGNVISGWSNGLKGQKVGSRVLLVVPPDEGYGDEGSGETIKGDDTLVFVVDILAAY